MINYRRKIHRVHINDHPPPPLDTEQIIYRSSLDIFGQYLTGAFEWNDVKLCKEFIY